MQSSAADAPDPLARGAASASHSADGASPAHGSPNIFGKLGRATLVASSRPCHRRNVGCLEAYASGLAIAERARSVR